MCGGNFSQYMSCPNTYRKHIICFLGFLNVSYFVMYDFLDGSVDAYAAYRRRLWLHEEDNKMPTKTKFVSRYKKGGKRGKNGMKFKFDNHWLPGYNPALLMKYRCHINVEYCGSIRAINYLYKYIYKGTDQGYMSLKQYKEEKDEIKQHKYGRILTSNECHYRISGFKQHHLYPAVKKLGFFVPDKKRIVCEIGQVISEEEVKEQLRQTEYYKWMARNKLEYQIWQEFQRRRNDCETESEILQLKTEVNKKLGYDVVCVKREDGKLVLSRMSDDLMSGPNNDLPLAFEMVYEDFGKRYSFNTSQKQWKRRKSGGQNVVVRLLMAYPGTDYFYLRKLLRARTHIFKPEDLLTDPETMEEFDTYRQACVNLGLVTGSIEYFHAIHEAHEMGFGRWKLLGLFAQMIIATDINNVDEIWNGPKDLTSVDQIEQQYPQGYKHLMMLYPDHIRRLPNFKYDFWQLPNETIRRECEQSLVFM